MSADAWSYGGGVQSVAIAVLIAQGKLPRPEVALIADTGREKRATWEYTDAHVRPLLAPLGIEIVRVQGLASVDLYGHNGDLLIPFYTTGGDGKARTLCSTEWKQRPIRRWLRAHGYGPENPVRLWLGISTDEAHRAKDSDAKWIAHHYPLLFDVPTNRAECLRLMEKAGLPTPPKSSCWMCPQMGPAQWKRQRDEAPDEWAEAIALDAELRQRDPNVFLHRSGKPLPLAPMPAEDEPTLFDACESGYCYV